MNEHSHVGSAMQTAEHDEQNGLVFEGRGGIGISMNQCDSDDCKMTAPVSH